MRTSENPPFRACPKWGASNAQPINLARMRQAKWTEKPLCGDPRGKTASASEAFRTVSLNLSEKGNE